MLPMPSGVKVWIGTGITDIAHSGQAHENRLPRSSCPTRKTGWCRRRPDDTHPRCWFRSSSARRLRHIRGSEYVAGSAWRDARWTNWTRRLLKKGSLPTKSASGRSRTKVAKAASISRLVLALRTWICSPMARAAASTSLNVVSAFADWPD